MTARDGSRPAPPHAPAAAAPDRSLVARSWYGTIRVATTLYGALTGGVRVTGRGNLPRAGGAVLAANHLSYLDVFVLGLGVPRPLRYVARRGLFVPVLGPLIRSVGGFPIDNEGGGTAGLKEALRRLKGGSIVLIFPEGTRSRDGELGPLKPGIAALSRAKVPFVPVAVAGTFEAWPRGRLVPRPHPIRIHYGRPISPEEQARLDPDALSALLRDRLLAAQRIARAGLARDLGRRPGTGTGPARRVENG
jgi:1-acyl-sn-glycerol-3-phosphate acyltransferase